jgi:calreticulin
MALPLTFPLVPLVACLQTLYNYKDLKYVGFELWQVKSGSIFDNIIVADSYEEAEKFANDTWAKTKDAEKEAFDKVGSTTA